MINATMQVATEQQKYCSLKNEYVYNILTAIASTKSGRQTNDTF